MFILRESLAKLLQVLTVFEPQSSLIKLQRPRDEFCKVFPRAWSVIGLKGYFIQQGFHTVGAPEAWLKLIETRLTNLGFF